MRMDGVLGPKRCVVRVLASTAAAAEADRTAWPPLTPQESVALVWPLTLEQYRLAGLIKDEPRLCRTITRIVRR